MKTSERFNDEQRARIDQAVTEAEARTSAEIVPVVAASSGRYDRAEDVFGLWVGVMVMMLVGLLLPREPTETGAWGGVSPLLRVLAMAGAMIAGFVAGAAIASRAWGLRRAFTPSAQMRDEVNARARALFYDQTIHHTGQNTGVLIFVSLYERLAVVLADQAVLDKLGQPAIDTMCAVLTARMKEGDITAALCATVREAGERLALPLPRQAGDVNELSNVLVTID